MHHFKKGDYFGEQAILEHGKRTSSVLAEGRVAEKASVAHYTVYTYVSSHPISVHQLQTNLTWIFSFDSLERWVAKPDQQHVVYA